MWDLVLISNFHLSNNPWCQVGIQHVMASFLPGHYFPQGRHHVLYQVDSSKQNVFFLSLVFFSVPMFLFTGCGRWRKPCSMWLHHHRQASAYLQSFASECWMFHSYSIPTFNPLQGSVCWYLDGCYTHNLTLILTLSDQVLRAGRLSPNKLHVQGRPRRPHTTGLQDDAVLSSQGILSARSSRSFCQPVCFVVTRDFERKII